MEEITIERLRKNGYKVRVIHDVLSENDEYYDIAKHLTSIQILDPKGKEWDGHARCSMKDQYDRKLGNKIALRRALKKMNEFYIDETINLVSNRNFY